MPPPMKVITYSVLSTTKACDNVRQGKKGRNQFSTNASATLCSDVFCVRYVFYDASL